MEAPFLIFYKGPGKIFDKLIRFFCRSKYSHVELVINGISYSADAWTNQVRGLPWTSFVAGNWDVVPVAVDVDVAEKFLRGECGRAYDFIGVVGVAIPFWHPQERAKWYCSELCAKALGIDPNAIAPGSRRGWIRGLYEVVT